MRKKFNLGDIVYLITDEEQKRRMVTGILERSSGYVYYLSCGEGFETNHYHFEISDKEDLVFKLK